MKSKIADLSVKNSGLNTIFNAGKCFWIFLVVPGTTVDLKRIIGLLDLGILISVRLFISCHCLCFEY